jgi:hypothetical protein
MRVLDNVTFSLTVRPHDIELQSEPTGEGFIEKWVDNESTAGSMLRKTYQSRSIFI